VTPRIHFFPKGGPWLASSRYRVFHVARALETRGWQCVTHDPPRLLRRYLAHRLGRAPSTTELVRTRALETLRNARALWGARRGDILFAQRSVYSRLFAAMLLMARRGRPLIFDIDDAVFERQGETTARLTRAADLVVVGSHELERYADSVGARKVHLFPTSVPLAQYPPRPEQRSPSPVTIGWMGTGPEHYENIRILRAPLMTLSHRIHFLFLFVGSLGDPALHSLLETFDGVRLEIIPRIEWEDPAAVARVLHRFDIGLMPLTDTPRHRAKCAFKAIESMACGVPVVVSRVGENVHLLREGRGGFLAGTEAEWEERLFDLASSPNLRTEMGRAARAIVEDGYGLEKNVALFDACLRELIPQQPQ